MIIRPRLQAGRAAALAGAVLLTAACSAALPGTPVAATARATTSSPSSPVSFPVSSSVSSAAASSITVPSTPPSSAVVSTVTVTASSPAPPASSDDTVVEPPTPVDTVVPDLPPVDIDPVTEQWAGTMCTQMGGVLVAVFAAPGLDGSEPLDYRSEWSAYYAAMADTVIVATGEMAALPPPSITDGQQLHDGFLTYLKELGLAAGNGSIAVAEAPDDESALLAVQDTQAAIAALEDGDYGLSGFQDGELSAVLARIPECQSLGG